MHWNTVVLKVYALKKFDEVVRIPLCGILPRAPIYGKRQNLVGVTRKQAVHFVLLFFVLSPNAAWTHRARRSIYVLKHRSVESLCPEKVWRGSSHSALRNIAEGSHLWETAKSRRVTRKKSRISGFFFLYFSLFAFHFSLFSESAYGEINPSRINL